jgi:hypothetical protein
MKTHTMITKLADLYIAALRLEARAELADELADIYFNLFGPRESQYWTRRAYYRRLGAARLRRAAANTALQINQKLNEESKPTQKQAIQTCSDQRQP